MKRSDFYIRLTTGVLLVAVLVYIGYSLYNYFMNIFETTPALEYAVEESIIIDGFVVRTEVVLDYRGNSILPAVSDGERVASGQAVAVEYLTTEALELAGEIRLLRNRIAQLENMGGRLAAAAARLDSVLALSRAVQSGDFGRLDETAQTVETLVFEIGADERAALEGMRARLATLEARTSGIRTFHTPYSGTFSQVVDGFEHITPDDLNNLSPAALDVLFSRSSGAVRSGKIVTSFKWYFVSTVSEQDASRFSAGRDVTVRFFGTFHAEMVMRVESIGESDDEGLNVVVFSSNRAIHDVASIRSLQGEIVFDVVSGLRVPKEAIRLDENGTLFIFIHTASRAERVDIEILLEFDDFYLVRDGAESGSHLRSGSTIIVRANNLYHNKVIR